MNKQFSQLIMSAMILLLAFTAWHPTVEAANPINPKQSRVTHLLKDANGKQYKVYFSGIKEKKAYASFEHDWALVWAGASEGDLLYHGNYKLYMQKVGVSHIQSTKYSYPDYTLNSTRKMVHMYPSKQKGQPDLLAVAETGSSNSEYADWYYIKNGVLTKIANVEYTKRAQVIGKNTFLTANYDNSVGKWFFYKMSFNPSKNKLTTTKQTYKNPEQVIKNWKKHWK
ncbi:hypothetical protein [Bacillus sp. REN10]|uniref:hypothetical protein n=1 Tax=Bacillus sp. REN10 TaxID=2782541 RepID=UPI00193B3709|nr:hypothetical protein [Bacillus sp. REN10]